MVDKPKESSLLGKLGSSLWKTTLSGAGGLYQWANQGAAEEDGERVNQYAKARQERQLMQSASRQFMQIKERAAIELNREIQELERIRENGGTVELLEDPAGMEMINYGPIIELRKQMMVGTRALTIGYLINTKTGEATKYIV